MQKPYVKISVISDDGELSVSFTKEMVDYANFDLLRFYYAQVCNDLGLSDDSLFALRSSPPIGPEPTNNSYTSHRVLGSPPKPPYRPLNPPE